MTAEGAAAMDFALDEFGLDGKVALVTGVGSRGNSIGRAMAMGLAAAGAAVVAASRTVDGAAAVAREIEAAGGRALALPVDIADPASVATMMAGIEARFGGVDILVNNAALMVDAPFAPATEVSIEDWNRLMAVNVTGALHCVQASVGAMRARGGGRIVNILSGGAFPAMSLYGVSKLALLGLTTTLAFELGRDGITVNAIAPGNVMSDAGKLLSGHGSAFVEWLKATVAMRAQGEPHELVGPLLLLCSPAGRWMTGQVLHVDGGWVVRP
jgi:NAD(P)-dependent dehydrogenase (short-subunit alcohol dehydrogenase family)